MTLCGELIIMLACFKIDWVLFMSTSKCSSLVFMKLEWGDEGQEECVLSVSLKGSSFIVIASFVSLSHAVFNGIAGKHSSSMSAGKVG